MTTQHLGSFGTPRTAVDMTFDYFEEVAVRVNPLVTDLGLVDFMNTAGGVDTDNVYQAMQTMVDWLKQQIHPDDWDRFYAAAKRNGQQVADLMDVARKITEAVAGFPTGRSSDSRRERRRKERGKKSKGGSSSPGGPRLHETIPGTVVEQPKRFPDRDGDRTVVALHLLRGRPDLQQTVVDRAAHRSLTG